MYRHFQKAIAANPTGLDAMLKRIDAYHIRGQLTDEQRESLIDQAKQVAQPSMDMAQEIQKLWSEIRKLNNGMNTLALLKGNQSGDTDATDGETGAAAPEYKQPTGAHDAYYNGDVVMWKGAEYVCAAPDGVACVWNPDVMPGYWMLTGTEAEGDE